MTDKIHELCKDIVRDFCTETSYSVCEYNDIEHFCVDLSDETKGFIYVTEAKRICSSSDDQTCYWLDTDTVKQLKTRDISAAPTFICVVDFKDGEVYYEKLRNLEKSFQIGNTCYPLTLEQQHVWSKCQFTNSFTIKDADLERYKELTDSTPAPTQTRQLTDKEIVQRFAKLVGLSPREILLAVINENTARFESKRRRLQNLLQEFTEETS